jgi:serine/threonine-protein kinase HipA
LLSPAYDLINTKLHVDDTDFALQKGLFSDDYRSEYFTKTEHPCKTDFKELARRIGIAEIRIEKLLHPFLIKQDFVETLVMRSFLSDANKRGYLMMYQTKRNHLIAE